MGVIKEIKPELVVDVTDATKPKEKTERPKKFHVVMKHESIIPIPCAACILKAVFDKSRGEAYKHIFTAIAKNGASVLLTTKEVAETKADDANSFAAFKSITCSKAASKVLFEVKPD